MQLAPKRDQTTAVRPDHGASFDALVRECYPALLRLAWLLTGDQHQAEDAVGEVLAKALRRWDSTSMAHPAAYLRRAVVNEVNSSFRRLRTRRAHRARRHGDDRGQRPADEQVVDADALGVAYRSSSEAVAVLFQSGCRPSSAPRWCCASTKGCRKPRPPR